MQDGGVNFGVLILLVISGWALLSIVVALVVGGMTKALDNGAEPSRPAGR